MAWTSVNTRLPECGRKDGSLGTPVIICHGQGKDQVVEAAFFGRRITSKPKFYLFGSVIDGVTHWQPMPKPPGAKPA